MRRITVEFIGGPCDGLQLTGPGDVMPGVVIIEQKAMALRPQVTGRCADCTTEVTYVLEEYSRRNGKAWPIDENDSKVGRRYVPELDAQWPMPSAY